MIFPLKKSINDKTIANNNIEEKFFFGLKNENIKVDSAKNNPKSKGKRIKTNGINGLKISSKVKEFVSQ